MDSILPFFFGTVFSPRATKAMSAAYDAAVAKLPYERSPILNEVIARRIINRAKRGELDPERLCRFALAGIGMAENK